MIELKSCPFCGSDEVYLTANSENIVSVKCSLCPAMAESGIIGVDEIIKAWNTRANTEKLALLDRLTERVSESAFFDTQDESSLNHVIEELKQEFEL